MKVMFKITQKCDLQDQDRAQVCVSGLNGPSSDLQMSRFSEERVPFDQLDGKNIFFGSSKDIAAAVRVLQKSLRLGSNCKLFILDITFDLHQR